jgi:hypothetical protein
MHNLPKPIALCLFAFSALCGQAMASPINPSAVAGSQSDYFPNSSQVSVAELMGALNAQANVIAQSSAVRKEFQSLIAKYGLKEDEALYADYVRIKLAFETTRAGGLWGIAWNITDQQPQSDRIWSQWQRAGAGITSAQATTAIAECDELSALFAYVAKRIGISKRSQVGLFWPTSNHTVAVWMISGAKPIRIVVPTSQIFLDGAQSLDTNGFNPFKQKQIYDYGREDISMKSTIPAPLANYFIKQVKQYAALSQGQLQTMRNEREQKQRR